MPKNVQEWQNLLLAIPMNWQIQGHPSTKDISRNVSFYSGMAVFLTFQSCGLACPQHLILTLCVRLVPFKWSQVLDMKGCIFYIKGAEWQGYSFQHDNVLLTFVLPLLNGLLLFFNPFKNYIFI